MGLPNDRPRYYCVAVLKSAMDRNAGDDRTDGVGIALRRYLSEAATATTDGSGNPEVLLAVPELGVAAETCGDRYQDDEKRCRVNAAPIVDFLDEDSSDKSLLRVPEKLLERDASWCFDIVTPQSCRSACFTSGYGKFVRGTGSVLYTGVIEAETASNLALQRPDDRIFDANWMEGMDAKHLRYFSGTEMARLFGFDDSFRFPPGTTLKQQWKLMGNSLNVRIASRLCQLVLQVAFPLSTAVGNSTGFSASGSSCKGRTSGTKKLEDRYDESLIQ